MRINTYSVCTALADAMKSKELAGVEKNPIQKYCLDNFGQKAKIYNQVAIDKDSYTKPYITISTIAQNKKQKDVIGIDIDFAIPVDEVAEQEIDGVISYIDREKLSIFSDIIVGIVEASCVNYQDSNIIFAPNPIEFDKQEFSGNIEVTFEKSILLGKDR